MGLLTSVNNINYTIEEQRKQKALEKIQKQKEKIKQEELKAYKNDLESFVKNEFNNYFNIAGSVYIFEFYNKDRKAEILNNFFDTIKITDSKGFEKIPYKRELEQHFCNKYNTILNKCKKEQEQQEIYNIMTEKKETQTEAEEEEKKNKILNNIKIIFIVIACIVFFPIVFIISLIFGTCKHSK